MPGAPTNWSHHADLLRDLGRGPPWRASPDILDDLEQEQLASMRVHETLLRRVMHLRTPEIRKLQDADYMREHGYSVLACPLGEELPFSGPGSLRGHVAWVYSEPVQEKRLKPALQSIGINLEDFLVVEVKPNSCSSFEAELFLTSDPVFRWDTDVHSPTEAIQLRGCTYWPWAGRLVPDGVEKEALASMLCLWASCIVVSLWPLCILLGTRDAVHDV
ncbi:unnamed protein product [Symbiodinium sp. CCMP2592]|nr:unnamed protein product [Symbiodinium sp. CCMP2592]